MKPVHDAGHLTNQESSVHVVGMPATLVNMCAAPPKAKKAPLKDKQMRSIASVFMRRGTPEPEPPVQVNEAPGAAKRVKDPEARSLR